MFSENVLPKPNLSIHRANFLSIIFVCSKYHITQVTTPLLKFMCEFVLNKTQRLTFDSSSPNGILLFREVSKIIVAYGSRILLLPNGTDIYGSKYKGIWISLTLLSRGEYKLFLLANLYTTIVFYRFAGIAGGIHCVTL
jgi:hypothetical protein